jgi:5-(carboxyamino)imidazole ribonucleotide synthase
VTEVLPGENIGILGGGQLGRMLAIPARQLGYGVLVLEPLPDAPAAGLADRVVRASFEDVDAAKSMAEACGVVTYEFENVSASVVAALQGRVHPSAEILKITQNRILEHAFLHRLGIPTAPGIPVSSKGEIEAWLEAHPGVITRLKTAQGGYDGGGQWRLKSKDDIPDIQHVCLLEQEVCFEREISVVVARDQAGNIELFPIFENRHQSGILVETLAPARISPALEKQAYELGRALAEACELVGVMTAELFVVDEQLMVNELAPRVHNSGHLSIEACEVSQFEQHIRAICGLPLKKPVLRSPAAMLNLLGSQDIKKPRLRGLAQALSVPDVAVHLYGKNASRPRRKMGHVTALGSSWEEALSRSQAAHACLGFAG